eukprot:12290844-Alexandrium_andersonii.AAC.1
MAKDTQMKTSTPGAHVAIIARFCFKVWAGPARTARATGKNVRSTAHAASDRRSVPLVGQAL